MRMLAAAVLVCVLHGAGAIGQTKASPAFDVTVIKPASPDDRGMGWDSDNNLTKITNYTLVDLMRQAYELKADGQVLNAPDWAGKEHYDLTAKISPEEFRRQDALPRAERRAARLQMLQAMLAERFSLKVEASTRRMPRMALVRVSATNLGPGLKVTPAGPDGAPVGGGNSSRNSSNVKTDFSVSGLTMDDLANRLSGMAETGRRVVVNKTGLSGLYNFKVTYATDNGMGVSAEAILPGLLDTLRDELGLKLVKEEGDVPVVIVTAAQKPELD